jgi:plastocyanin
MRASRRAPAVLLVAALLLAGCSNNRESPINRRPQASGSQTASDVAGVQQITLTVDATDRFSPDVITVHPGMVKVTLVYSGSGAPHDFLVTGFPGDFVPLVNGNSMGSATFTAPAPGTYQFVCTIHVTQGMTGKLIVTAG